MHPALSVILFTTFSGAGYGLLALLGVLSALTLLPQGHGFAILSLGTGLGFVTFGLLSSTAHLKHPERAWRAVSQWRSSWLSREGIVSILAYGPILTFAYLWIVKGALHGVLGIITTLVCLVTVSCTAMIYASLKSIPAWHNPLVLPIYHGFALQLGMVWLLACLAITGDVPLTYLFVAIALSALVWVLKYLYWRHLDTAAPQSNANTATGLDGTVTAFAAPHTEQNYLQKGMGYKIARKHARLLRRLSLGLGLILPIILLVMSILTSGLLQTALLCLTALTATTGALIERWLFFAEAKHVMNIYYDAS